METMRQECNKAALGPSRPAGWQHGQPQTEKVACLPPPLGTSLAVQGLLAEMDRKLCLTTLLKKRGS